MGRAKAVLPFGRTTILERILRELGPRFDQIIVVAAPAAGEPFPVDPIVQGVAGAVLVRDRNPYAGPAQALIRGLAAATNEVAFACSCDLPLLRADFARSLCDMLGDYQAVIPEVGGRLQPLCAAYRRACGAALAAGRIASRAAPAAARRASRDDAAAPAADRDDAAAASAEPSLTSLVSRLTLRIVGESELRLLDPDLKCFFNVNTSEDYARALSLAGL